MQTVAEIREMLRNADEREFEVLSRALVADTRKGVRQAVEVARRRLEAEREERERLQGLYAFQEQLAEGKLVVGLDEVGRGPLAGPLTVGAVVLPAQPMLAGLNDSKQLSPQQREHLSTQIRETAIAWHIEHAQPSEIDERGMAATLRATFSRALAAIDGLVPGIGCVIVDGNPLHIDPREVNVVKGDTRCASVAAASIIAKVERDALMDAYAVQYPEYGFESCKGYGSQKHLEAIAEHGLSPLHRRSFCHFHTQESLF